MEFQDHYVEIVMYRKDDVVYPICEDDNNDVKMDCNSDGDDSDLDDDDFEVFLRSRRLTDINNDNNNIISEIKLGDRDAYQLILIDVNRRIFRLRAGFSLSIYQLDPQGYIKELPKLDVGFGLENLGAFVSRYSTDCKVIDSLTGQVMYKLPGTFKPHFLTFCKCYAVSCPNSNQWLFNIFKFSRCGDELIKENFMLDYKTLVPDTPDPKVHDTRAIIYDIGSAEEFIMVIRYYYQWPQAVHTLTLLRINVKDFTKPVARVDFKDVNIILKNKIIQFNKPVNDCKYITPEFLLTNDLAVAQAHIDPQLLKLLARGNHVESCLIMDNAHNRFRQTIKSFLNHYFINDLANIIQDYMGYY